MRICGLQKLTLLDFPEKTAATVFTGGCNLRCPYCHNAALVMRPHDCPELRHEEIYSFLESRRGKLDGVCISGGEPLLQRGLEDFIRTVRDMGFLIKLDTNGCSPQKLRGLIDAGILDYVAMDIKNAPEKYAQTVGLPDFDVSFVFESVALLKEGQVPYEFRTTAVKGLHTLEDFTAIGRMLEGAERYFIQGFADSGDLVGFSGDGNFCELSEFSRAELEKIANAVSPYVQTVSIRG